MLRYDRNFSLDNNYYNKIVGPEPTFEKWWVPKNLETDVTGEMSWQITAITVHWSIVDERLT